MYINQTASVKNYCCVCTGAATTTPVIITPSTVGTGKLKFMTHMTDVIVLGGQNMFVGQQQQCLPQPQLGPSSFSF